MHDLHELKVVEFEINSNCNLRCSYCPNSKDQRVEQGVLDLGLYENIIQQLAEFDFSGRISFDFYNEPLLNSDLLTYMNIANKYLPKARIIIYSNGTVLTKKMLLQLIESKLHQIIITKHEDVKNIPLDSFFDQLDNLTKKYIKYQQHDDIIKYNRGGILPHLVNKIRPLTPCYLPMTLISVTNQGKVLPCFEDFYQELEMGDLTKNSLKEIWYSQKYQSFINDLKKGLRHKHSPCSKCNRTYDKSDLG